MQLTTHPVEPEAGPWQSVSLTDFARELEQRCGGFDHPDRLVVAVDGRSAGGKSTLSSRLLGVLSGAEVVHTDDVAWWHDFFGWDDLLISGVLTPFLAGEPVDFRPPAWEARGRQGSIAVSGEARVLIVEGVGSSRRSLTPLLNAAVWVQSDWVVAEQRGIARDMRTERPDPEQAKRFWDEWEAHERAFLAADRPWERADFVVCGTPDIALSSDDVLLGRRLSD